MKAGPYIQRMIADCHQWASYYRKSAAGFRKKAEEAERKAAECDADAIRWASGTDLEQSNAPDH